MARKTKAELERQCAEADRIAWEAFRPRLEVLQSIADAWTLVAEAPRPDSPGRHYYKNLGFFLETFAVPAGSSYAEKVLYLGFIKRLDMAGQLKAGALQHIEEALRLAMESQGSW